MLSAIIPLRHELERSFAKGETPVERLRHKPAEVCILIPIEIELGAIDKAAEVAPPAPERGQRMPDVELRSGNFGVPGIELRGNPPTHVTRVQPQRLRIRCGRDDDVVAEEIRYVLLKNPDTEQAALLRIVFERKVIVVRRPGTKGGVAQRDAPGDGVGIDGVLVIIIDRGVGNDLHQIRTAVRLGVGKPRDQIRSDVVGEMETRVIPIVGPLRRRSALGVGQSQLFDGIRGTRLRFPDTLAGRSASKGAVRIADEHGVRLYQWPAAADVCLFESHATQHFQPITEEIHFALEVSGRDRLLEGQ